MYIYTSMCVYIYTCIYIYMSMCMYIYMCICVSMYLCVVATVSPRLNEDPGKRDQSNNESVLTSFFDNSRVKWFAAQILVLNTNRIEKSPDLLSSFHSKFLVSILLVLRIDNFVLQMNSLCCYRKIFRSLINTQVCSEFVSCMYWSDI